MTASSLVAGCRGSEIEDESWTVYEAGEVHYGFHGCKDLVDLEGRRWLRYDDRPTVDLAFYVRLRNADGTPAAGRRVLYSYGKVEKELAGVPVYVFSQELTTDEHGLVSVRGGAEIRLRLEGRYWSQGMETSSSTSSGSTSTDSRGAGVFLGPIGFGGGTSTTNGSSSSTSTTYESMEGGFYVQVRETSYPIRLDAGEFQGSLLVLPDAEEGPRDAQLTSRSEREAIVSAGARRMSVFVANHLEGVNEEGAYWIDRAYGFLQYDLKDEFPETCVAIRDEFLATRAEESTAVTKFFAHDVSGGELGSTEEVDCARYEELVDSTTCTHDFRRLVFEEFRLP